MLGQIKAYLALAALAVSLVLIGGAYLKGRSDMNETWEAKSLQLKLDTALRDLTVAQKAAQAAQVSQAKAQAESLTALRKQEDYEKELKHRPECDLTDDDVSRLRDQASGASRKAAPGTP